MSKKIIGMMIAVAIVSGAVGGLLGFGISKHFLASEQLGGRQQFMANGNMRFQGGPGGATGFGAGRGVGQAGDPAARQLARGLMGEVTSIDDKSVTLKLPDGSSKIVLLAESTQLEKTSPAQKTDVKSGDQVRIIGSSNSDGSITASMIMLNPPMPMATNSDKVRQ